MWIYSFIMWGILTGAPPQESNAIETLKNQFDYDTKQALDTKEKLSFERDGVKVFDITYASPRGGRVTAFLVVPTASGPHAGLLFGHWGAGNRTEFLPEAILYAKAGAVSLLVDYPWVRPAPWRKGLKLAEDPENDHRAFVQAVIDLRRGLDLLSIRPDTDKNRIAYVGHSYGAQWGAILSATDDRLRTAVLMGGIPDAAAIWRDSNEPMAVEYRASTPKEKQEAYLKTMERTAAVRYVPHARCPLLFEFARHERYFDEAAMNRYYTAAKEPKAIKWYDTGHDLNDIQALSDRANWLHDKVGIKPIGPILAEALGSK